jgi:predicted Zn finger-like uncharacterized protein
MFKVVPDQLRVSDGWVRCGQCNEVFDANLNLQADTDLLVGGATHESDSPPDATDDSVGDPFLAVNPHALHFEPEPVSDQLAEQHVEAADSDMRGVFAHEDDGQASGDMAKHSFMRPKDVSPIWMRRSVRVFLWFFCLVLCLLLVFQVVLRERDRIAATEPTTKMAMDALCSIVGCTVSPVRQIESVVIDSSAFTKVRSDVYRLGFSLKNTSQISVATPALELTLTDLQDQAVIRRIFTAADFGDKQEVMGAGTELAISLPLSVKMSGGPEKISGYRLLSFYP